MTPLTLVRLAVLVLGLVNLVLLLRTQPPPSIARIHIQRDPALTLRRLAIPSMTPVTLFTEESVHYSPLAETEWASLVPTSNHGLVLLDDPDDPATPRLYAITMFHTLHCLDRIRHAIVHGPSSAAHPAEHESPLQSRYHAHHCLNYVRQQILCAADTRLNPPNHVLPSGMRATNGIGLAYTCRDWRRVYEAFDALNRTMVS